jgi:hypothetical protein
MGGSALGEWYNPEELRPARRIPEGKGLWSSWTGARSIEKPASLRLLAATAPAQGLDELHDAIG